MRHHLAATGSGSGIIRAEARSPRSEPRGLTFATRGRILSSGVLGRAVEHYQTFFQVNDLGVEQSDLGNRSRTIVCRTLLVSGFAMAGRAAGRRTLPGIFRPDLCQWQN